MTELRRILAVGAILSLAALLLSPLLWGEPDPRRKRPEGINADRANPRLDDRLAADLAASRFAKQPLVVYQPAKGDLVFALQLKPQLADAPARPRDWVVVVDTSASKAKGPLNQARQIAHGLAGKLGDGDRLALLTANVNPRDLTRGLKGKDKLQDALKDLDAEIPLGAVDLKKTLLKALDAFDDRDGRQRLILFLGDGKSVAGPLDAEDRADLAGRMVKRQIAYFAVPLGARPEPLNLHGLVSSTGGLCVRLNPRDDLEPFVARLLKAAGEPVLYPTALELPPAVQEVMPSKLPPLRRDSSTLVVGRLKAGLERFDYTVSGTVAGKEVQVRGVQKVPQPEVDNFFLVNIVTQWEQQKDRPAMLQADRALAFAFDQNQMARADLLAKAEWAVEKKKWDEAIRLFEQALQVDPHSPEARGGLNLVKRLKAGEKVDLEGDRLVRLDRAGKRVVKAEQPPAPDARDEAADKAIAQAKARRAIAEQQAGQGVSDAIREAQRRVLTEPDAAYESLRRTLQNVRDNDVLGPQARRSLENRLSQAMVAVYNRGVVVKDQQARDLALRVAAAARVQNLAAEQLVHDRIRERMRVFHNLMDQAREEEAYRQAQAIRVDQINQGLPVPTAVTAGYQTALSAYNLRELQELRRIREERWLATLMQVEKSHVPFPDEPPVEFPAPAVWRAITDLRKARYESSGFGAEMPKRAFELRDSLARVVDYGGLEDKNTKLVEALDQLAKAYNLTFDVNDKAFKAAGVDNVLETAVGDPPIPPMKVTLGTVLRKILSRVAVPSDSATFLIRREVIEITTGQAAVAEKAIRVYPVADLVVPIPNSINTQVANQSLTLFGFAGTMGMGGLGMMGMGALGMMGMAGMGMGMGGLGLGGLGMGGLGMGALGLAGGMGGLGMGALGQGGMMAGMAGIAGGGFNNLGGPGGGGAQGFRGNFQGQGNMGMGGVVGFGSMLGQYGNLGGQFGLQGGNQSQILITTIRQIVGKPSDWALRYDPVTGDPINPLDDSNDAGIQGRENNNLGFYPPAMALVVKAPSTMHSRASTLVITGAGGGMTAAPDPRREGVKVAGAGDDRDDDKTAKKKDPRTVWQDALAKGVDNPALIIATADFLALNKKWDHAAEFLKANLKQGIVVRPWVYRSLAIALREGGGSPEEIERAEVSAPDLEPLDAQGYLDAARQLAQSKRYGRALAFCRHAAELVPNAPQPYAQALDYAELAKDGKAMEWAAGRLLQQEWPADNKSLQGRAAQKLTQLAETLEKDGRKAEAQRLLGAERAQRRRDLVIKASWQGKADVDLNVKEPTGSTCWSLNRMTVGGGTLIGNTIDPKAADFSETYVAAQAFPGVYEVTLSRVWGRPLGDKVQLRVVRNQGTPDQTEDIITVKLDSELSKPIKVSLADGRRTDTAYVPPPSAQKAEAPPAPPAISTDKVLAKIRTLADPEVTSVDRGVRGDTYTPGGQTLPRPVTAPDPKGPLPSDQVLYQTKVAPFVANTLSVTAQATISADRRYVRLSMNPVFNVVGRVQTLPVVVTNPLIPGGRR